MPFTSVGQTSDDMPTHATTGLNDPRALSLGTVVTPYYSTGYNAVVGSTDNAKRDYH